MNIPFYAQLINLLAAMVLLVAFAMLTQRRILSLVNLFAAQGVALALSTAIVAYATHQPHLYGSALLTVALKVGLLPWLLHRLIQRLDVKWDVEGLINVPTTMLIGIALFVPWGIAAAGDWVGLPIALGALVVKLAVAGVGLALLETVSAKMRIFRAPEFLGTAFMLATLGMLTHFLLER